MAESKKDKLLYGICRTLVCEEENTGIKSSFEQLCRALSLDAAFLLKTCEIPFLLEMKNLWEESKHIAGHRILIDYTQAPDWEILNKIRTDKERVVVNDSKVERQGEVTNDFVDELEIGAYVICGLMHNDELLGAAVFVSFEPRVWEEKELDLMSEVTGLIACQVDRIKTKESQDYLLAESDKVLKEANEAKNRFMSNLSHEFRTPINSIVGMVAIMRHNVESPEVLSECLDRMEKSTKSLIDMVNDCVDMTLLNSKEMLVNESWIPMDSLIASVKGAVELMVESRGQQLDIDYDSSIAFYGDEVKIGRILINALSNSSRMSEEGTSIYLTITSEKAGDKKNMVVFRIRDEVIGIDEETAKYVFNPLGSDKYISLKGMGFNMMIAKHLVDLMNGTIEFFSDGWGTELVVSLPLDVKGEKVETKAVEITDDTNTEYAEMYIGRRILIAEDNMLMGEILATILGYRGLETEMALNGQEAFDKFSEHEPFYYDMILMDIQMPIMDGLEATRAIRESDKADATMIPIAALSANALAEDEKRAMESGMNAYLRKPVGEKELFNTISSLVL